MDLKKRLASLDRMNRKPVAGSTGGKAVDTKKIATEKLGLSRLEEAGGSVFIRDYADSLQPPGGLLPDFRGFLTQPGSGGLTAEDVLFLDTETTGLVGGTGTIAFLVGVSWWEGSQFLTRQYFLCGPGGEAPMLKSLHQLAGRFQCVATYNGASFDLPLLRTRALLNRLDQPWNELLGWDLLVPARRLWGRKLENCRQQTIESAVCCLKRDSRDIAGNLIPQTWFNYLQLGHWEDLPRVLYHNHRDMLGMAHIFRQMVDMACGLTEASEGGQTGWLDAWAFGRLAEIRAEVALSVHWMDVARKAAALVPGAFADRHFTADAVRILKRSGDWEMVENVIACALDCGQNEDWLHREAAILFEHRLIDLDRARRHALVIGDEHRLNRLYRKQQLQEIRGVMEDPQ